MADRLTYTAREMRGMADAAVMEADYDSDHNATYRDMYCPGNVFTPSKAEAMLRYAADVVERCEKKRRELDEERFCDGADELTMPMEDCYGIIDYILRGDAGKAGK